MPPFDSRPTTSMPMACGHNPAQLQQCTSCPVREQTMCSSLDAEEMRRLGEIVHSYAIPAQGTLFAEGQPAEFLYNVVTGAVRLYKLLPDGRRAITGFVMAGDFIGLSVLENYAYTAEAISPTSVCRYPRRQLERLMDELPHLQKRLFAMAGNELAAAQDQMLLLGRKTAEEKICSFLLLLAERGTRFGHAADQLALPMSRTDIADYLGLTTETVSRIFTRLKTGQLIRLLADSQVKLVDMIKLQAIATGEAA